MSRFRKEHRKLDVAEVEAIEALKDKADEIDRMIAHQATLEGRDKRCLALATTKLEEALMWAVKGITA